MIMSLKKISGVYQLYSEIIKNYVGISILTRRGKNARRG
jgi:hypothetical protein